MKPFFRSLWYAAILTVGSASIAHTQSLPWYTEGDWQPDMRIDLTLTNVLDIDRVDCPVTVTRDMMPIHDLHEMWVTVVDPKGSPYDGEGGGHAIEAETNGHQLFRQLDDLDRDGVWDELFFQTDIGANETKTLHIYIGFSQRGWNEHGTHANIGSYCRHLVPFWESAHVGWKLWFPTNCDFYGKREPVLMSNELYMKNMDGYAVPYEYGSDIQRVASSFGAGGICLFEDPSQPGTVSRPRIKEYTGGGMILSPASFNNGQITDTRYTYDVVVNGPVRSMIRVRTLNWQTDRGSYELEQLYTAYTNQNYSTCRVTCTQFLPRYEGVMLGCGIRKNAAEFDSLHEGNLVVTIGDDEISDPDDPQGSIHVDYVGNALVVRDCFNPEYQWVAADDGNHTFRVPANESRSFEYMIAGAWSEGAVLKTPAAFKDYMRRTAREYNNPVMVTVGGIETKE